MLPLFSLICDFGKQSTLRNVSKISVSLACYRQIGSKPTNHSPLAWRKEGLKVTLVAVIGGFRSESVDNMQDWRKFWKRFRRCFVVLQSRVSTKTVVINKQVGSPGIGKTDSNLPKQYISMTLNKTISQHEIENRLTCSFATEYTYTEYVT